MNKHTEMIQIYHCEYDNPDHLNAVVNLLGMYMADPMGEQEPLSKIQQLRLIDGLANHPTAVVLLAYKDDIPVGVATCFVNFSTFLVGSFLNIHDFYVHTDFRNQGIATALMEYLVDYAREKKMCKLTLEVRCDNTKAQSLYSKFGIISCNPEMYYWSKKL